MFFYCFWTCTRHRKKKKLGKKNKKCPFTIFGPVRGTANKKTSRKSTTEFVFIFFVLFFFSEKGLAAGPYKGISRGPPWPFKGISRGGGILQGRSKGFPGGLPAWPFKRIFRGASCMAFQRDFQGVSLHGLSKGFSGGLLHGLTKGLPGGAFCMALQRDSQKGYSQNGDLSGARLINKSGGCYLKRLIKHAFFMFDLFFWILDLDIGMVFWGIPLGRFLVVLRFKNQILEMKFPNRKPVLRNKYHTHMISIFYLMVNGCFSSIFSNVKKIPCCAYRCVISIHAFASQAENFELPSSCIQACHLVTYFWT